MAVSADQVPVVAIASGKGGVGKTTAAVNVALALTALGVRVPFSAPAARDADRGLPVMVTQTIPEQVTAYQLVARHVRGAIARGPELADLN